MPGQPARAKRADSPPDSPGETIMDHFSRIYRAAALLTAVIATSLTLLTPAASQESFKLGIVTFLSGPAADSFGVPRPSGCQFVIDQLNKDCAPSPFDKVW